MNLPSRADIEAALQRRSRKIGFTNLFSARLGNGNGVITQPALLPANTWVYYHVEDETSATGIRVGSAQLIGGGIPYTEDPTLEGLAITVGLPPEGFGFPGECVIGLGGLEGTETANGGDLLTTIIVNNIINPSTSQIVPLKVEPLSPTSLGVNVRGPHLYQNPVSRETVFFSGATLTTEIADAVALLTGSQHVIGLVYLNIFTGALGLMLGPIATSDTAPPNRAAFAIADVGNFPVDWRSVTPCGVVYLYVGQTAVKTEDILSTLEVRPISQTPKPQLPGLIKQIYTNPQIFVDSDGTILAITNGPQIKPVGTLNRSVKFETSADQTIAGGVDVTANPVKILFDTEDINDESAGNWDGSEFTFTAPVAGIYKIGGALTYNGVFASGAAFYYSMLVGSSSDKIIHGRVTNWTDAVTFTGFIYVELSAGAVTRIRARVVPTAASITVWAGSYILIEWVDPATAGLHLRTIDGLTDVAAVQTIQVDNRSLTAVSAGVARIRSPGASRILTDRAGSVLVDRDGNVLEES